MGGAATSPRCGPFEGRRRSRPARGSGLRLRRTLRTRAGPVWSITRSQWSAWCGIWRTILGVRLAGRRWVHVVAGAVWERLRPHEWCQDAVNILSYCGTLVQQQFVFVYLRLFAIWHPKPFNLHTIFSPFHSFLLLSRYLDKLSLILKTRTEQHCCPDISVAILIWTTQWQFEGRTL